MSRIRLKTDRVKWVERVSQCVCVIPTSDLFHISGDVPVGSRNGLKSIKYVNGVAVMNGRTRSLNVPATTVKQSIDVISSPISDDTTSMTQGMIPNIAPYAQYHDIPKTGHTFALSAFNHWAIVPGDPLDKEIGQRYSAIMICIDTSGWMKSTESRRFMIIGFFVIESDCPECNNLKIKKSKCMLPFTFIFIWNNSFQGTIPHELGRLSRLRRLYLEANKFSGVIPTNLSRCSNLKDLWLNENMLAGSIPNEMSLLLKLSVLAIDQNNLTGGIPPFLGNITSMELFATLITSDDCEPKKDKGVMLNLPFQYPCCKPAILHNLS
ncbi:kinase-like domain-containing protein [Tanacetum coccineum]